MVLLISLRKDSTVQSEFKLRAYTAEEVSQDNKKTEQCMSSQPLQQLWEKYASVVLSVLV